MSLQRVKAKSLLISIFLHVIFIFLVYHQLSGYEEIETRRLKKNGKVQEIAIEISSPKNDIKRLAVQTPTTEKATFQVDQPSNDNISKEYPFTPKYLLEEIEQENLLLTSEPLEIQWKKLEIPYDLTTPSEKLPAVYQAFREEKDKPEAPNIKWSKISLPEQEVDFSLEEHTLPIMALQEESVAPTSSVEQVKATVPSLKSLSTLSWGDFFDYDIVYYPDGDEYVFALTLMPKKDVLFPRMKQHIHFLVDTSHAIQAKRLKTSIHAIMRALSIFSEDDLISITCFDSKMKKLVRYLPNTGSNKKTIRSLTSQIELGNIFASPDPYKPLQAILFDQTNSSYLDSLVLISDGKGLSTKQNNLHLMQNWTAANQGRYHLHAVATDSDSTTPLLDLFCSFNKGKLHLSHSVIGLKRKMQKLAHSIKYPIAKDLHLSAYSKKNDSIALYPSMTLLPALYLGEPLVIWGKSSDLQDFTLFVQGRNLSHWINIKKKISFRNAKGAEPSFAKLWDKQRAYQCYDNYFRYQDPNYLLQAKEILSSHDIEAFTP